MNIHNIANILKKKFGEDIDIIINYDSNIIQLLTDSRNHFNGEDSLFFAIKTIGGNDGHNYIRELYEKGIRNFIVEYFPENITFKDDINIIRVNNTIEALNEIGSKHRKRAKEVVAIAGSRGKTTLKEMIFQLMEPFKNISRSPRSFNSKIGVPLSLWHISKESDLAIIETGISKTNEMSRLQKAVKPDTVIFTNIGEAHAQGFNSNKEKADEKVKIAEGNETKTIIYCEDDIFLNEAINRLDKQKTLIKWSTKNPNVNLYISKVKTLNNNENLIQYTWNNTKGNIVVSIEKEYDLENIVNALVFMLYQGISPKQIQERFKVFHRINTRLNVSDGINGCSLILDSYTSDLSSLLPAIDFMKRRCMPNQSLTLIISDLHHEGSNPEKTYQKIAQIVKETNISRFIGIGPNLNLNRNLFPKNSQFFINTSLFLKSLSASDFNDEIILLKGSPEFNFTTIYNQLEAKKHETVLEINLDALLRNYNYFRSMIPSSTGIIAMVKASGYGAGSYEIAKTLQDAGAAYLAVAALDEGIELRNKGIVMPVLVMNPRAANYKSLFKNHLEPVIYTFSMLEELIVEAVKYGEFKYPVHLKLDTGMHRMGFEENDLEKLIYLLSKTSNIHIASIFSHLATADCLDMDKFTLGQFDKFERMSQRLIVSLGYPVKRHILNSAGIIRFPQYHYEMVRLGIGLYGANTLPEKIEKPLAQVSTLRSVIICIREIEGEEAVGYGRKGVINRKTRIATIPIGYADGMNRRFGNGAIKVMINGKKVPTIGNICMDATMIDVTDVDCKEGDSVEIFGENMSLKHLSETLQTIPYEILTSVSPRVKRIYFRE